MAPLLEKLVLLDRSNKQRKARETKEKTCNRVGPREGTSTTGKEPVSDQGPSAC
jgi:hypothetical protein